MRELLASKPSGNSGQVTINAGITPAVGPPTAVVGKKEESTMATPLAQQPDAKSNGETRPGILDRAKGSLKEGAKLAAANEAGELVLQAMIGVMPQLEALTETPTGKALGKVISALAVSYAAEASGFESALVVQGVCDKVVTAASMELTADKIKLLRPVFHKLTELSKQLAEVDKPPSEVVNG